MKGRSGLVHSITPSYPVFVLTDTLKTSLRSLSKRKEQFHYKKRGIKREKQGRPYAWITDLVVVGRTLVTSIGSVSISKRCRLF